MRKRESDSINVAEIHSELVFIRQEMMTRRSDNLCGSQAANCLQKIPNDEKEATKNDFIKLYDNLIQYWKEVDVMRIPNICLGTLRQFEEFQVLKQALEVLFENKDTAELSGVQLWTTSISPTHYWGLNLIMNAARAAVPTEPRPLSAPTFASSSSWSP
ncbi:hypothetical protein EVAR_29852_1 [Eumeta japonica]|uniref:Uncharacterized protein n=1 Tax=Eumeta variegata TaxID=151549 RepID=A0A4C1VWG3_EUMVA|nr:hypothetical protein EVAR_29852_1 [Eumeta japonica]